jgi:hypothetical protein
MEAKNLKNKTTKNDPISLALIKPTKTNTTMIKKTSNETQVFAQSLHDHMAKIKINNNKNGNY